MRSGKENIILNLTFEFALLIIEYCELLEEKRKYQISKHWSTIIKAKGYQFNIVENYRYSEKEY